MVKEPGNGDFHAELGNLYLETRQPSLALPELQAAAFLTPERPHIYCQLAQAALDSRRRADAVAMLDEALRRAPNCEHALGVKGELLLRDDNIKDALTAFKALAEASPGLAMAHQKIGYLLLSVDRPEEAVTALKAGLKHHPHDVALHALLGDAYSRRPSEPGWDALAEEHLLKALPNNPAALSVHTALGKLYLRRGDLNAARKEYEEALKAPPPPPSALYSLAQIARRQNRLKDAEALLASYRREEAVQRQLSNLQDRAAASPEDLQAHLKLARFCLARRYAVAAERALDAAVGIDPAHREVRELRGQLYRLLGEAEKASREFAVSASLKTANSTP